MLLSFSWLSQHHGDAELQFGKLIGARSAWFSAQVSSSFRNLERCSYVRSLLRCWAIESWIGAFMLWLTGGCCPNFPLGSPWWSKRAAVWAASRSGAFLPVLRHSWLVGLLCLGVVWPRAAEDPAVAGGIHNLVWTCSSSPAK